MLSIIASLSILLSTLPATPQTASPEKAASPEKGTSPDSSFTVPGTTTAIELFEKGGRSWYRVSFDRGRTWHAAQAAQPEIHLSYASFDPLVQEPRVDKALLASPLSRLFIVQFRTQVFEAYLRHLRNLGVEVHHYLPMQAYLVRMAPSRAQAVRALRYVRWVGPLHAAYKIDPVVLARARVSRDTAGRRYDVGLVAGDRDRSALIASIESIGGKIDHPNPGNVLLEATLDPEQLVRVAGMDEVTWIDYSGPPEEDMNNARIFGGANYIEFKSPLRYTGKGVRGHIMEGIYPNHREFTATSPWRGAPVGFRNTSPSTHGTATFGVVFAKGVSPTARGLCPDGQGYFTHYAYVFNGYGVRKTLVADLQRLYGVMFQTASWGYSRTTVYTNRSQEMDDLIFDLDIPITQSQSNAGATPSRPQAWAKNILSIGGIRHYNTLTPTDDRWARAGSTGPASDMRIKPTLCGYYDSIYTTYSSTGYGQFGGTSGATPINAGHVGLQLEMWTDGIFGYPMQPGGWQARFKNRPHFTTTKAMLVNFAWQYPFSASWHDLSRYKQGWGWPNVQKMYDQRDRVLVINEQDVLRNLGSKRYRVFVKSGAPELKVTMTYNDPAQIPTSGITRINDVDLKVTAPNNTTVYHGNNGLVSGNYSSPGGVKNGRDTVENVFVKNPAQGVWTIDVTAAQVNRDAHKETTAADVDYALVASGINGNRSRAGTTLDLTTKGNGDLTFTLKIPASLAWTQGWTLLSLNSKKPRGHGDLFGVELDSLTLGTLAWPVSVGSPIHFQKTAANVYPNVPFALPAGSLTILKGLSLDGMALLANGTSFLDTSNVSRVKL